MIPENPKDTVRAGYDLVSHAYRDDAGKDCGKYLEWVEELRPHLRPGSEVLELGCGCGIPVAREMAKTHPYIGVDLSPVQIERARKLAPSAKFLCGDMAELGFPDQSFGAVLCLYAIIHLPLAEQKPLLVRIHQWLETKGWLMVIVGWGAWTGTARDWLGVKDATMYWSHTDFETYRAWLAETGFTVHSYRFVPEGEGGHYLLLAQKTVGSPRSTVRG